MPLQATSGTASYDAFGGGAAAGPTYIEDVFSTYLYTGTGATQTITNGIDLAGKGGLVWAKIRSGFDSPLSHALFDTSRGVLNRLASNLTDAQASTANSLTAFNSTGFTVGSSVTVNGGGAGDSYVSWTFRKQPKFFDVVTYTGNGANRTIAHNLNAAVGFIIIKRTDAVSDWATWHKSLPPATGNDFYIALNSNNAISGPTVFNSTAPTSTVFSVGTSTLTNASGGTYVAYLFADSNSGGFGLLGTDSVIDCGSVSAGSSAQRSTVNLGWEPQLILLKKYSGTGSPTDWIIVDSMRDLKATFNGVTSTMLNPNSSVADNSLTGLGITSTGFTIDAGLYSFGTFQSYFYIAIRRGPMKVPTSGTSVFSPVARAGTSATANVTAGFAPDAVFVRARSSAAMNVLDKLRGADNVLQTSNTDIDQAYAGTLTGFLNTGYTVGTNNLSNGALNYINYPLQRAPSFFDEVCYTGTGGGANAFLDVSHNLGVTPEMIIVKRRDSADTAPYSWPVYHQAYTSAGVGAAWMVSNIAKTTDYVWRRGASGQKVDASTFSLNGNYLMSNASGGTYVAYLFATCAGVSKVGSYTGNGSSQTINCGFTGGARFVLIKRTDSTGDWYVWDTARGIVTANDPHLSLNTTAAEVTTDDTIDTDSTGFVVNQVTATNVNVTSATYIFLAIA